MARWEIWVRGKYRSDEYASVGVTKAEIRRLENVSEESLGETVIDYGPINGFQFRPECCNCCRVNEACQSLEGVSASNF